MQYRDLISEDLILSGHDRSDGGLITTLLEMAFGGNCGIEINISIMSQNSGVRIRSHPPPTPALEDEGKGGGETSELSLLFSEELGLVIEYLPENEEILSQYLKDDSSSIPVYR